MEALMAMADGTKVEEAQEAFYATGSAVFLFAAGTALIGMLLGILYMTVVIAPNLTQRCAGALRDRSFLSFLAGLPVGGVFVALLALGQKAPAVGGVAFMAGLVALCVGYTAAAEDIGRRLYWACGKEGSRASRLAGGWLVFAFGSLFPILGWFLIFPYVSLAGLGSIVVGAFRPAARDTEYAKD